MRYVLYAAVTGFTCIALYAVSNRQLRMGHWPVDRQAMRYLSARLQRGSRLGCPAAAREDLAACLSCRTLLLPHLVYANNNDLDTQLLIQLDSQHPQPLPFYSDTLAAYAGNHARYYLLKRRH